MANDERYGQLNVDIEAFESELDRPEADLTPEDLKGVFLDSG